MIRYELKRGVGLKKGKTTMELCAELGISRTTFKGWVYDILERKQDPYDNTTLVFDDEEIIKLWQIRFYKQLKYSNESIRKIINNSGFDLNESLEMQINELTKQKEELEVLIKLATVMKESGVTPTSFKFGIIENEDLDYENITEILTTMLYNVVLSFDNDNFSLNITEEDANALFNSLERILKFKAQKYNFTHYEVQKQISEIQKILSKYIESEFLFAYGNVFLSADSVLGRTIDKEYEKNCALYLGKALNYNYKPDIMNKIDKEFGDILTRIEKLGYRKYSTNSKEVQQEIYQLHQLFKRLIFCSEKIPVEILKNYGNSIGSESLIKKYDNGNARGILWFVSRSIEIYCNNSSEIMNT